MPGGQSHPPQRENGSQGTGTGAERPRGLKFLCFSYPPQRKGPGLALAPAAALVPGCLWAVRAASWAGDVGKIQAGDTVAEGSGGGKSRRWRVHPFPCRWGSSLFSVSPLGSAPSCSSPSFVLSPACAGAGLARCQLRGAQIRARGLGGLQPRWSCEHQHGSGTVGRVQTGESQRQQTGLTLGGVL